mmetsp:Transcript_21598/g.63395  ORF Transcript_21598/g.63395 Transcript_21598/m.63395 type:complete len:267 (-) Transcript_21598:723-1523(-)
MLWEAWPRTAQACMGPRRHQKCRLLCERPRRRPRRRGASRSTPFSSTGDASARGRFLPPAESRTGRPTAEPVRPCIDPRALSTPPRLRRRRRRRRDRSSSPSSLSLLLLPLSPSSAGAPHRPPLLRTYHAPAPMPIRIGPFLELLLLLLVDGQAGCCNRGRKCRERQKTRSRSIRASRTGPVARGGGTSSRLRGEDLTVVRESKGAVGGYRSRERAINGGIVVVARQFVDAVHHSSQYIFTVLGVHAASSFLSAPPPPLLPPNDLP